MFDSLSGRAQSFCQRAALACAFGLMVGFGSVISVAAKESSSPPADTAVVDLFAGIKDGTVAATVIPRDSKKVTLQLKNNSGKPLAIRLPEAFAAVPVLAQFGGGGGLFGGGNGGGGFGQGGGNQLGGQQGGGTQGLGVAGGQNGAIGNGGARRNRGGGAGVFNVPAGKVVKVKLTSVCLEYGKPEPSARNEYVVQPMEALCDKPEVVSILRSLGDGEVSQEVAQLAAWNVANGTSFEQIASLTSKLGLPQPIYSQEAISAAVEFVGIVSAEAKTEGSGASATTASAVR